MKGIRLCGACADYDMKKHRCKRGAHIEENPRNPFYDDCQLPDVVEVVRCKDCKQFTEGMAVGMCKRIPDKPIIPMPYNAFCAFGERKGK